MAYAQVSFDVFLSHNSQDKPCVRQLAHALKARGLRPWLDEWELRPGQSWQDDLERIVTACRSAAVCVAGNGLGPWEQPEMRALLRRFVSEKKRGNNLPVIPVLLPGAPPGVNLPVFLEEFTWCDLRDGISGIGLDRLEWGITGIRPASLEGWAAATEAVVVPETSTVPPATVSPATVSPATVSPATVAPTTVAPTTVAPTTVLPTPRGPEAVVPTPKASVPKTSSPEVHAQSETGPVTALAPIRLKVVVCYLHPERRDKLVDLRKACLALAPKIIAEAVEANGVQEAVERVRRQAETTILLLDGFEPGSRQLEDYLGPMRQPQPFHVLINDPEWHQASAPNASASLFEPHVPTATSDRTLVPTLRKALLRLGTQQLTDARLLSNQEELAAWFELRYRVWTEMKYLAPNKVCPETPWELDYTDRTSLPLGLFSKADGRLLGGARLVRGFGEDHPRQIDIVDGMLGERKARLLIDNFRYPDGQNQPFDILSEMSRFQQYYCELVRAGVSKAEVSRVVVEKPYRQFGLGEVIVDTLISVAREHGIQVLFLACHKKHAGLYERNGFHVIEGVVGDRFLTYEVPCIAMERREESLPSHVVAG